MPVGFEHSSRRWIAGPLALAAGLVVAMPATAHAAVVAAVHPGHDMPAPGGQCEDSVESASLTPFSEHIDHAHLERSPQQQVSDIQSTNAYVATHVALVQSMARPGQDALSSVPEDSMTPFVEHMKYAHIQRPAQQQVSDAEQTDDYVKLHTVLVEHMTRPGRTALIGGC